MLFTQLIKVDRSFFQDQLGHVTTFVSPFTCYITGWLKWMHLAPVMNVLEFYGVKKLDCHEGLMVLC